MASAPLGNSPWWTRTENGVGVVSRFGDCVVVSESPTGPYVAQADPLIGVSADLLERACAEDWPEVAVDGPFLGICGQVVYRATGEEATTGMVVYERITPWEPAPAPDSAAEPDGAGADGEGEL